MFDLFREYQLENEQDIKAKYSSAIVKWYKTKHIADMDGLEFTTPKPAKDWDERLAAAKDFTKGQVAQIG